MPHHAGFAITGVSPSPRERILVVEDEAEFGAELSGMLRRYGYDVTVVGDPRQMMSALETFSPNIMIIDQFLQDTDMVSRLDDIRRSFQGGLMVLTGNNDISDKVIALERGADDFVLKTTNPREVLARLRALGRRQAAQVTLTASPGVVSAEQNLAGWTVDAGRREVRSPEGAVIPLTGLEYDIFHLLQKNAGTVVPREVLAQDIFQRRVHAVGRSIENLVSRVRTKFVPHMGGKELIRSVRARGYVFVGFV